MNNIYETRENFGLEPGEDLTSKGIIATHYDVNKRIDKEIQTLCNEIDEATVKRFLSIPKPSNIGSVFISNLTCDEAISGIKSFHQACRMLPIPKPFCQIYQDSK